jgi:hypothetical protein
MSGETCLFLSMLFRVLLLFCCYVGRRASQTCNRIQLNYRYFVGLTFTRQRTAILQTFVSRHTEHGFLFTPGFQTTPLPVSLLLFYICCACVRTRRGDAYKTSISIQQQSLQPTNSREPRIKLLICCRSYFIS